MRKLNFMVGRWVGSGWNLNQSGQREEFTQTEKVHKAISGLVLSVEGQGRAKSDPSTVVDSALAVINYNDTTSQYRWEAFSQGFVTEAVPVVGDNTFQWNLVETGVTIRYTLQFTHTAWHEIGEITLDGGTTWRQNFQMDLHRIA